MEPVAVVVQAVVAALVEQVEAVTETAATHFVEAATVAVEFESVVAFVVVVVVVGRCTVTAL